MQEQEGAEYGDNQTDSDNDSALESHSQHQNDYNDNDGFNQVDYESPQRSSYTLRLIEHFVALYTGGQAVFFQLRQFLLYGGADFYNIRSAGGRDKNALRPFAVEEQFVAGRFFVSFFDTGNVAHTELVVVMSLNQHIAYVVLFCPFRVVRTSAGFTPRFAMRSCNREMLIHSGRLPYSSTRSTSSMSLISRLMSSA